MENIIDGLIMIENKASELLSDITVNQDEIEKLIEKNAHEINTRIKKHTENEIKRIKKTAADESEHEINIIAKDIRSKLRKLEELYVSKHVLYENEIFNKILER